MIFLSFLGSLLAGCKKDIDTESPSISILQPTEGSFYKVGDSIIVTAEISDNVSIESVEVRLNRLSNNAKVNTSVFRNVGSKKYNLNLLYVISDTLLRTDEYYISVLAFDGENLGKAFQKLHISGLAKKRLSVLALTTDGSISSLYELNNNEYKTLHTFNSDYGGAGISHVDQVLYFCGSFDNQIFAYDLKNNLTLWSQSYLSQPDVPVFNQLSMDDIERNAAISLRLDFVDVLNSKGMLIKKFELQQDQLPQKQFLEQELSFIESLSLNSNIHQLEIFKSGTTAFYDRKHISFEAVEIFEISDDKALIFGNVSGASKLFEYNYSSKSIRTMDEIVNDSMLEVLKIDPNFYLISTPNDIYTYHLKSGSTIEYLSGITANSIAYDPLNKLLFIGSKNEYYIYNFTEANRLEMGILPMKIKKILVRYNID